MAHHAGQTHGQSVAGTGPGRLWVIKEGSATKSRRHLHRSWINPKLEVRDSKRHAKGVFAREAVSKKERLALIVGDVMLVDETGPRPSGAEYLAGD